MQSISIECFSIYLLLLLFLSLMSSAYISLASLVKAIQRYFILFYAIVNGITFIPDSLLLMYKNTTDFCILIFFYLETLLNLLVVTAEQLFGCLYFLFISCHKWRQFYLFLIWMTFISFSCLLLCQGLLVLCWIKVVSMSILVCYWSYRKCFQFFIIMLLAVDLS